MSAQNHATEPLTMGSLLVPPFLNTMCEALHQNIFPNQWWGGGVYVFTVQGTRS